MTSGLSIILMMLTPGREVEVISSISLSRRSSFSIGSVTNVSTRSALAPGYIQLFGVPEEEVLVEIDSSMASSLKLSATSIADAIASADAKVAAGQLYNDGGITPAGSSGCTPDK